MFKFSASTIFLAALAHAHLTAYAQAPSPAPGPAPNARQVRPDIPSDVVPRPGKGERLALTTPDGPKIVKLHCTLGPYVLVMLPTGEITLVESVRTKPTEEPFVAAAEDNMTESLKEAGLGKFKTARSKYYLYCYDCSEAFYMHARSILESMLPGIVSSLKSWDLPISRPEVPMVVVIVSDRAAYDRLGQMPPEVIAYYNQLSNHIVMYEDAKMWNAAPEYAAKQAGYVIAHEGVHQLLANVGIQKRLSNWAPWISEGLAEYYCPLKINSNLIRKGDSELPTRTMRWTKAGMVNDLRMHTLLHMPTASGDMLNQLLTADEINAHGYALAWGLVHYLATEKPKAFRAYMAEISQYEPLDPKNRTLAGRPDEAFLKHVGKDFTAIEREIQKHLTSRDMQRDYVDPIQNQTHYVVRSVDKRGRTFAVQLVITTSPDAAKQWKEQQQAANKDARIFTKICKTRAEAEFQIEKLKAQ